MSGSTAACVLTRAAWALWRVQGSQPVCLPQSCPGWLHLSCCQVPSPTSSARWAGPFGAEEGCLTQAHTVTQGLALGASGAWPGEPPWEVMAGSGGCFAVGRVCVCVCLCVCLGLVSRQGPFPPPLPTPAAFPSPCSPLSLHTKATSCEAAWTSAAFMPSVCAVKHFHGASLI